MEWTKEPRPPARGLRVGCPPPAIRRWLRVLLPTRNHPHSRRHRSRAVSILGSSSTTPTVSTMQMHGDDPSRPQPSSARAGRTPRHRSPGTEARRRFELPVSERPMNEPLEHRAGEAEVVFLPELECPGEGKPGARGSFFSPLSSPGRRSRWAPSRVRHVFDATAPLRVPAHGPGPHIGMTR
jgi:hypothetical protein